MKEWRVENGNYYVGALSFSAPTEIPAFANNALEESVPMESGPLTSD
ncbi:MAG: hypothetical protein FJ042_00185 [Candidatus Cloacimonetes bacterium]|nr:hypothetical protein [Candidatus Cloacimonadota bacterium]